MIPRALQIKIQTPTCSLLDFTCSGPCLVHQSHLGPLSSSPSILSWAFIFQDYNHPSTHMIPGLTNEFSWLPVPISPLTPKATKSSFTSYQSTVTPVSKVIFLNYQLTWVQVATPNLKLTLLKWSPWCYFLFRLCYFLVSLNFPSSVYYSSTSLAPSSIFSTLIFPLCTLL